MERVAVVIPTLNDERSIKPAIDRIPAEDRLKGRYKTAIYTVQGRSLDRKRSISVTTRSENVGAHPCS